MDIEIAQRPVRWVYTFRIQNAVTLNSSYDEHICSTLFAESSEYLLTTNFKMGETCLSEREYQLQIIQLNLSYYKERNVSRYQLK